MEDEKKGGRTDQEGTLEIKRRFAELRADKQLLDLVADAPAAACRRCFDLCC